MTCDASIVRIVLDPAGQPLDVGRSTRTISAALRTALERRDGACRFPACDRKSAQCDAHHIQHWGHGGESAPPNLVLLCRHHHRLLHEGGFGIHGSPADELHFTRPDGTILDDPLPVPRGSFLLRFDDP